MHRTNSSVKRCVSAKWLNVITKESTLAELSTKRLPYRLRASWETLTSLWSAYIANTQTDVFPSLRVFALYPVTDT